MFKSPTLIFDFDDTIWARDKELENTSIFNAWFIKERLSNRTIIISGNTYKSIEEKLKKAEVNSFPMVIADANSTLYRDGRSVCTFYDCDITHDAKILNDYLKKFSDLKSSFVYGHSGEIVNFKIRPIESDKFRQAAVEHLNSVVIPNLGLKKIVAKATGKTTIDIVSIYNSKRLVYNKLNLHRYNTLYIGDEIDSGNDKDIAEVCTDCIRVSSVKDTANLFKIWV